MRKARSGTGSRAIKALVLVGLAIAVASTSALVALSDERSHSDEQIVALQRALGESRSPEEQASIAEKLRMAEEARREELDARKSTVARGAAEEKMRRDQEEYAKNAPIEKIYRPTVPAGSGFIVEGGTPVFPSAEFLKKNEWFRQTIDGKTEVAWAGANGADHEQGLLITTEEGPTPRRVTRHPAPGRHGAVRVTSADGAVLELEAADGTIFHFDMDAKAYR